MAELTQNQNERIRNLNAIQATAGFIGIASGIIYAKKTGGKWYRYLGYSLLGGMMFGLPAALLITPFKNKILKEADIKADTKADTKSDKKV